MNKKRFLLLYILTCMICLTCGDNSIFGADEKTRSWIRKKREEAQAFTQSNIDGESDESAATKQIPVQAEPATARTAPAGTQKEESKKLKSALESQEKPSASSSLSAPAAPVSASLASSGFQPEPEEIEFHFENASLQNLIAQIEEIFGVTFVTDDILDPLPKDGKTIKGNKISFKTHKPLTRKQAWDLFITFLDIAGFNIVPMPEPKMLRIQKFQSVLKSALKAYIGIEPELLPDNEEVIRYVYFIENSTVEAITNIVNQLKSHGAELVSLREHRAFILTDKAYNIKTLMKIVKELDQVSMPQSMAVLKLRRTNAEDVKKLYDSLIGAEEKPDYTSRLFAARKQPTSTFFPENTRIIAEPRTNALILLGSQDAIKKIEDFIVKFVDIDIDLPYPKLQPLKLKYADAATVAEILTNMTKFGSDTPAGKAGGVRGGDKYLKSMSFIPVRETNTLIIQGEYDDYLQVLEIIKELDAPQPQIAVEVLVLSMLIDEDKGMGTQLRTKVPGRTQGLFGRDVVFQTSGFMATGQNGTASQVVENTSATLGVQRLLGDLVSLANTAIPGNTLITLGQDLFGVWGIFNLLQTVTDTEIVANPFMIVANKAVAKIEVGEARRIVESQIVPSAAPTQISQKDDQAVLSVQITPQINAADGKILLDVVILNEVYTTPVSNEPDAGDKNKKEIVTSTLVTDKEVLALGGFTRNNVQHILNKTPILGDIPVLGWLFKNKQVVQIKENLLILISTRIVEANAPEEMNKFTQEKIKDYRETKSAHDISEEHDPIYKMFFGQTITERMLDEFIFERAKAAPVVQEKPGCCADTKPMPKQPKVECCPDTKPTQSGPIQPKVDAEQPRAILNNKKKKQKKSLADYLPENEVNS